MSEGIPTVPDDIQKEGAEAILDWLVNNGWLTVAALERKTADLRKQTGELARAAATVKDSADVKEKTLPPEQAEALLEILKARFASNMEFHKGILWTDVEKALRAEPNLLWSLQQLEATGGEPDVLQDKGDAFRFGDFSQESPPGRRNVAFDIEGETLLRKRRPDINFQGNAADRVAEWGVEFMSRDEYDFLQEIIEVDSATKNWLRTPADIRRSGGALLGHRSGESYEVNSYDADDCDDAWGFRCSLSVPKVKL